MGMMDWLFGSSGGMEQVSTLTPQQQALQNQLLGGLGGATGQGMEWLQMLLSQDPQAMAQFEAPLKRQFEQETVPGIAERFAGMGSHGAASSSAFNQTMGQAGRELSENLGALRGQLGMQALSQLQGFLGQGMAPSFENIYKQPTTGVVGGVLQGVGSGVGMGLGAGPLSKMFGGKTGATG
jgi:hypothetical protein